MEQRFDIAVIGGGVVGLALLRRFSIAGLKCVLLERGSDMVLAAHFTPLGGRLGLVARCRARAP